MKYLTIFIFFFLQIDSFAEGNQAVHGGNVVPICTLIVKSANADTLDVWINGTKIGKTPIQIDTMKPGSYDISFLRPGLRDSILRLSNTENNPTLNRRYACELASCGIKDNRKSLLGDLAKESNKRIKIEPNAKKEVVFNLGEKKSYAWMGGLTILLLVLIGFFTSPLVTGSH